MTTNIVLLIVSVLLLAAALFSYFGYLRIASILYVRLVEEPKPGELKQSPYRITRYWNTYQNKDLYYIYKGNTMHVDRRFSTAKEAQTSLNELEQLEGYTHTKVV